MDRNVIYYKRYRRKGVRYELQIIPAGDIPLSNPTRIQISDRSLVNFSTGRVGFSAVQWGLHDTPILKKKINLRNLNTDNGNLREILMNPIIESGTNCNGTLQFKSSNIWKLMSDRGDGSLKYDEFIPEFVGIQRKLPSKTIKIPGGKNRVEMEFQIVDIGRACLEAITTKELGDYMRARAGDLTYLTREQELLYDTIFVDITTNTVEGKAEQVLDGQKEKARFYRLHDFFDGIRKLSLAAVRGYLRDNTATATWSGLVPFDNFIFFKQHGGPAILSADSIYVIGEVTALGDTWANAYSGLFVESEYSLIRDYKQCWDLMKNLVDNSALKARLKTTGTGIDLTILEMKSDDQDDEVITLNQLYNNADIEIEIGGLVQHGGITEIPTDRGAEDVSSVEVTGEGIENEETLSIGTVFTNHPSTRTAQLKVLSHSSRYDGSPDINNGWKYIFYVTPGYSLRRLWYFEQPAGFNKEVPIKVHYCTNITDGLVTHEQNITIPKPYFSFAFAVGGNVVTDANINAWRAYAMEVQRRACMGEILSRMAYQAFGYRKQSIIKFTAVLDYFRPERIGGRYLMGGLYLFNQPSLDGITRQTVLINTEPDYIKRLAKVELLTIEV